MTNKLLMSEKKVFSQNGEDGIIEEILLRLNLKSGYFLEFGVQSGQECNCAYLAKDKGWLGTFIESDSNDYNLLKNNYINYNVNILNDFVTSENIQDIINSLKVEVDLLSIDIDSQDYWVWEAITSLPKVVVIEYNAALKGKKAIVKGRQKPWDGTTAYGASLEAYIELGKRKGYTFIHTESHGVNAFFVRNDFANLFPEKDNPIMVDRNVANHPNTNEDVFVDV